MHLFLFRDRAFWVALPRVTLLVSVLLALFLAAYPFTALNALTLAGFFARGFAFPRFDLVTAGRLLRFAISIPSVAAG